MNKYTLKDLRWVFKKESISNIDTFLDDYYAFFTNMSQKNTDKIIGFIATLLVTGDDGLIKMAYYLSIHFAVITNDFAILRDISERLGYYPVVELINKIINNQNKEPGNISNLLSRVLSLTCKDKYYRTEEQYYFDRRVLGQNNVRAIAPYVLWKISAYDTKMY